MIKKKLEVNPSHKTHISIITVLGSAVVMQVDNLPGLLGVPKAPGSLNGVSLIVSLFVKSR